MNINQQEIQEEHDLLEKVLNFSFQIGGTTICFNQIADRVDLDLNVPKDENTDMLSVEEIQKFERIIQESENRLESLHEKARKMEELLPEEKRSPRPKELQDIYDECSWVSDYLGLWRDELYVIQNSGGRITTPLLGSFDAQNQKVYLYIENIEQASNPRTAALITTFIHETFHAWDYFSSSCKERTVREIDEPMVEFGTLLFLQEIAKSDPAFEPIFDWAKSTVHKKQDNTSSNAAYGFGYYLFSLIGSKEENTVQKLLEVYSRKSGSIIAFPKLIQQIKDLLYPCYPKKKENDVYEFFCRVLFAKAIRGQVWSKSGKTNIVTDNDVLLFDDNVDAITLIEHEGFGDRLIKIENNGTIMIYYRNRRHYWHPLFDEVFDEITEIKYGKENVIFVKPQNDKKAYLITHFDIRRIIDIKEHNNVTSNSGSLLQSICLSADDFVCFKDAPRLVGKDIVHDGFFICAKEGSIYNFIFPVFHRKPKVIKDVNVVNPHGVINYSDVHFFNYDSKEYVLIKKDEKTFIFTIDGIIIGEYDGFIPPLCNQYSLIVKDGKMNYFSFEKMNVLFDKWFDNAGRQIEEIDGIILFRVVEDGVPKILDEQGNDVSDNHAEYLQKWILQCEKDATQ